MIVLRCPVCFPSSPAVRRVVVAYLAAHATELVGLVRAAELAGDDDLAKELAAHAADVARARVALRGGGS